MNERRRRVLVAVAVGLGTPLAGCSATGGGDDGAADATTTASGTGDADRLPLPPDVERVELTDAQAARFKQFGDLDPARVTEVRLYEGTPTSDAGNDDHAAWFRDNRTVGQWTQQFARGQAAIYKRDATGLYIFFAAGNPIGESNDPMRDYFYLLRMPWRALEPVVATASP